MIVLFILVFLAGFVDSVAGGGGLISLPAYMITGVPVHTAYACNKFSAACGTTFSTIRYFKHKAIHVYTAFIAAITSFLGALAASHIVLLLDDKILKEMLIFIIPVVAVILFIKRNSGDENKFNQLRMVKGSILAAIIGLCIGFYDGLIGPGTGTFAIIAFTAVLKFDLKTASGNAKLLNLASNYASVITFIRADKIDYRIAVPAALFGILGNYIGAGVAIKKGKKFIQPMMLAVLVLLLAKMIWDLVV